MTTTVNFYDDSGDAVPVLAAENEDGTFSLSVRADIESGEVTVGSGLVTIENFPESYPITSADLSAIKLQTDKLTFDTVGNALQVQDRFLAIAEGEVTGHSVMLKFGRNPDIDSAAEETVWEGGGIYAFDTTAQSLEILSSSADDTSNGTGARTVTLIGQNASNVEQTVTITMNGVTPVAITGTWLRVYRCSVTTAGSGNVNAGTLTVRIADGGATRLVVGINNGQTLMAVYTIPAGKTGYMTRYYASLNTASPATAAAMDIKLFTKPSGGVINLKHQQSTMAGFLEYNFGAPFRIVEKTDIYLNAATSANNSDVCGGFDIILVNN